MVLLVRFGELALKSRYVRRQLRDRLVANIQDLFAAEGVECITEADEARVYVHTEDAGRARAILARVFGIVSMSPAVETKADLESITALALRESRVALESGMSFALRPRRAGTHPFTSQDLARAVGETIRTSIPGVRVDLTNPDVEIHLEARQNRAFVFREIWKGPGGLPLGSQGRALAFVHDEAGMVAAWMAMKRGCRVTIAAPDDGAFVDPLHRWDVRLKVLKASSASDFAECLRIARAEALFLGTRWETFRPEGRPAVPVPVFEPIIGLSDAEIAGEARHIRSG